MSQYYDFELSRGSGRSWRRDVRVMNLTVSK
jgi:hypothetical protein